MWVLPVVIRYRPPSKYFLCRICRTHIALQQELSDNLSRDDIVFGVFEKASNLLIVWDELDNDGIFVDAYCAGCKSLLGGKFVRSRVIGLFLDKLMFWNGDRMLDAVTMQPIAQASDSSARQ